MPKVSAAKNARLLVTQISIPYYCHPYDGARSTHKVYVENFDAFACSPNLQQSSPPNERGIVLQEYRIKLTRHRSTPRGTRHARLACHQKHAPRFPYIRWVGQNEDLLKYSHPYTSLNRKSKKCLQTPATIAVRGNHFLRCIAVASDAVQSASKILLRG